MAKEILLITNYFPPEKGAAANRMFSLAESLGKAGYNVTIVCPLPNYPSGRIFEDYRGKISFSERVSFGKVKRLWIWPSNSANKFVRLFSMLSFSFNLILYFIFTKTPKTTFIQYSPVFVGFTAVYLGKMFSKKIILNVSDLWPLAGLEMGILKEGFYYSLLQKMENYCYEGADLIVGQSQEILDHIGSIRKDKKLVLYRNIPQFKIPKLKQEEIPQEIKIVYAGLLGVGQGIFLICNQINFPEKISFHIYGAGPDADKIRSLNKKNIHFHGELSREDLHRELQKYQIAFVPLVKRIYGSVPSKIYEYSRLGLPILYFAGGEGGDVVEIKSLGWVLPVADLNSLQHFIDNLSEAELKKFSKSSVQTNSVLAFDFDSQFEELIMAIEG